MSDKQQQPESPEDENRLIAQRREKLDVIRGKRNAFPNDFRRKDLAGELHATHGESVKETLASKEIGACVAGRIIRQRGPFIVIQDVSGQIQLYLNIKEFPDEERTEIKSWDLGDIIGAKGKLFKTRTNELTVEVTEIILLTKSIRPLPEKFHGLSDQETKYRQRYVDLIVNEDTKKTFLNRSKIISNMRAFMEGHEFLEVETPMLHPIPGGATARPFETHHNALDMDMYLRIAPELYLKRLVVGGFDRVFEINRNFRNEGLSVRHNPEFTMMEFYAAYKEYKWLMDFTEDCIRDVTNKICGALKITYQDKTINF